MALRWSSAFSSLFFGVSFVGLRRFLGFEEEDFASVRERFAALPLVLEGVERVGAVVVPKANEEPELPAVFACSACRCRDEAPADAPLFGCRGMCMCEGGMCDGLLLVVFAVVLADATVNVAMSVSQVEVEADIMLVLPRRLLLLWPDDAAEDDAAEWVGGLACGKSGRDADAVICVRNPCAVPVGLLRRRSGVRLWSFSSSLY